MKSISGGLLAHLALGTTTLATCWKVTLTNGTIYGFTDYDQAITFSSQLYEASSGYTTANVQTSAELNVDNLEVDGILDSDSINDTDLLAGVWDFAAIEIFQVNRADLTQGSMWVRKGHLGEVSTTRSAFKAELRGMLQAYQQTIGRVYSPGCNADLGDSRCTVNLASFTVTGTLTSVASKSVFSDSARNEASGYFDYGLLTWTSGANNGLSMEVKTFTYFGSPGTALFTLQQPMPYTVAIGDTYSVYAGCDKTIGTCRDKFNNVINFRGFPYFPGNDRMLNGT